MITIPPIAPPLPRPSNFKRDLPSEAALHWLKAGWNDFRRQPISSLTYGLMIFTVSVAIIIGLFQFDLAYLLFPTLAGFMIVGPVIALGLYEKSRRLEVGQPVRLLSMMLVKPRSGGQVIFAGVLLVLVMALWERAAVLLYALFFGLLPFPGTDEIFQLLFQTPIGWALLVVGTLTGGLFAAFSFAISVFSIPMLLHERSDALTAMGTSMALVWNNLPVMIVWGAIVLALVVFSVVTALVGLVVVFPVLGHATWHAYREVRPDRGAGKNSP